MSKISEFKSKFAEIRDKIRDSEAFVQLKSRYDALDPQTKMGINVAWVAGIFLVILITVISSITTVNQLANELEEKEALVGWLQRAGDNLKQLKARLESGQENMDLNSPLNTFLENMSQSSGMNPEKISVGPEKPGTDIKQDIKQDIKTDRKEVKEFLCEVKMTRTNLKALTRFLFAITDNGQKRRLTVKDLTIDTKEDPEGYIDATMNVATYKEK